MEKTILQRVQELLEDQLGVNPDAIVESANIRADLGADSLDDIELVMALEEEFDIEIHDDQAARLDTVASIVSLVEELRPSLKS